MKHEHQSPVQIKPSLPLKKMWPIYFAVTLTTGASASISLVFAGLSINVTVIQISIWTSIVCFALVLWLVSVKRVGFAFLLSIAVTPIAFGIVSLYFSTRSFQKEVVQTSKDLGRLVVAKVLDPQPALDLVVQTGAIRKATIEDIKAFRNAYVEKKYVSKNLPIPENEDALAVTYVDVGRAYVVLNKFTFPSGLVNDYKVVFFAPVGSPRPSGDYGHSAIYHFDTLTVECTAARTGGVSC